MSFRSLTKKIFRRLGYELTPHSRLGVNAYLDIQRLCRPNRPVCFDVGANVGQTIRKLQKTLPGCIVHSFEPASAPFAEMQTKFGATPDVHLVNAGLGRAIETRALLEQSDSRLSSYLEPGDDHWSEVSGKSETKILTLDGYCHDNEIDRVDLLKIDTQGFELEVLGGATEMLKRGGIHLIYLELNCGDMYRTAPPLDEVLRFLREGGYSMVSLYRFYHDEQAAKWTDGLFIKR